jgi:hypothetical protein
VVKYSRSTVEVPLILTGLKQTEAAGMDGVAVKCIDIIQNTDCEGRWLCLS